MSSASVPLEVYELSRTMRHYLRSATRSLGFTQEQWRALWHLSRNEGLTQTNLAALLDVQPIQLTRALDRLAAKDLIERRPSPRDRRAIQVYLTKKAKPVIAQLAQLLEGLKATAVAGLSAADLERTSEVLRRMRANLDKHENSQSVA
ncbi:MAG: MarR family winged helix-turn-helix transcriptional regulator [Rhodospirillaceae bacterium]